MAYDQGSRASLLRLVLIAASADWERNFSTVTTDGTIIFLLGHLFSIDGGGDGIVDDCDVPLDLDLLPLQRRSDLSELDRSTLLVVVRGSLKPKEVAETLFCEATEDGSLHLKQKNRYQILSEDEFVVAILEKDKGYTILTQCCAHIFRTRPLY